MSPAPSRASLPPRSPSRSLPLVAAAAAVLAGFAPAQGAEPPPPAPAEPPQTLDVQFRGGSLAEYVAVIRSAGDKINIVMPPMASVVEIPPLSILDAEVEAALEVAAEIAGEKHRVGVKTHRSKSGRPIHVLHVREAQPQAVTVGQDPRESIVRVFSLANLTELPPGADQAAYPRIKAETVLTAIDTGLSVAAAEGGAAKAVIRYHTDSGLLFVQGTPPQIGVVQEVLSSLERDADRRRSMALQYERQRLPAPAQVEPKANGGR